jgi:glycosyltransferase involved in cell wall biosynthesis
MKDIKIIGITRVRNEEEIIVNTLNHVGELVDGIVVCDDASTDKTVELCEAHPKVLKVIKNKVWESNPIARNRAEGRLRQLPYNEAVKLGANWVYYFDADEYVDFSLVNLDKEVETYFFRLFDFYITNEDVDKDYLERKFMGPEYRDIPMLFKVNNSINFHQRVPSGHGKKMAIGGYVKHYGKAISVEEWDKTCDYYINHRWRGVSPMLHERWKKRVGKAIHTKSDFDTELITWGDRFNNNKIVRLDK